jgi:tetrapyrrole methylase family protein/MazG family protein
MYRTSGGRVEEKQSSDHKFSELIAVMAMLRGNNGCPWDKEQTHASLKSSLLEESYELLEALGGTDDAKLREELADLLHQIIFHCQIAGERGAFSAEDVVSELTDKMIRRHPHVFSGDPLPDKEAVLKQWARLKTEEKKGRASSSALGTLPKFMPALARAQKISERAAQVGFDWPDIGPVWEKVEEEISELKAACAEGNRVRIAAEMGDLLFSVVNIARFLQLDAEETLLAAVDRFTARFHHIEKRLLEAGKTPAASTAAELDALWNEAKALENKKTSRNESR